MNVKDNRERLWSTLEREIQNRASQKDRAFVLTGKWKRFVTTDSGFKVFAVDGKWIRNNLCVYFGHGGHGLVHEFIPRNEIWVSTHHYRESRSDVARCNCKTRSKDQKVSKNFFDSTVLHETVEFNLMKKGMRYWPAHQLALNKEREAGLVQDPHVDIK